MIEDTLPKEGELQKELRDAKTPEKVWEVIKKAIPEIICLKITTEVTGGEEGKEIYTMIDLLQADRKNKIHRDFLKDPDLAPLRDFHAEQVKLAEQDIQKKLEFLEALARTLVGIIKKVSKTTE
ncbi:MAG TPA: hypothetical protein VMW40_06510 [Candidatus Bathyarchaeia archaeon]|nr:hypothetical protein [Candidatus Bathyarchaeia archaeon]